jgi:tetratricopeptide (TPR) repeat protein
MVIKAVLALPMACVLLWFCTFSAWAEKTRPLPFLYSFSPPTSPFMNTTDLEQVRKAYFSATDSERKTESLLKEVRKKSVADPVYRAYEGACEAILAKYMWSPYSKLAQVNKAKDLFRKAIEAAPDNAEIRFLRFSVQHNLPDFLRNESDFQADKKFLLRTFEQNQTDLLSPYLIQQITTFLTQSGRYKPEERKIFEAYLTK